MRNRIFKFSSMLVLISVLVTAILINLVLFFDFSSNLKNEIKYEASVLASTINDVGEDSLQKIAVSESGRRITLISATGDVLYDSSADETNMENHLDREEIIAAIKTGNGEATRNSSSLGEDTWYYAVRLDNGNILRISKTTSSLLSYFLTSVPLVLLIIVFIAILGVFSASKLTKNIVMPINEIDLKNPDESKIYSELEPLIITIKAQNNMIDRQLIDFKKQQKEFSAITENMREGILVIDRNNQVLSYNSSALRLLSYPKSSAEGTNVFELNRSNAFRESVDNSLTGKASETLQEVNGLHLQITTNPVIADDKNKIGGAVITIFDISEKYDREQMRREFTANVSHELKTPLTSISGYAEIISNGIAKEKDIRGFAEKIYGEAQRLISLVNDIMKISKLDEDSPELTFEEVNLKAVCENVLRRVGDYALKKDVKITSCLESASIKGVPTVLDEMIYNLTENAIKYNRKGGEVNLNLEQNSDSIILTVKDTGIGIPIEEQERIFERFYRIEKSRETTEGTGLGLSIVKHGALVHGAKIQIDSNTGVGSKISLIFPAI